jgi:hypothetical protein
MSTFLLTPLASDVSKKFDRSRTLQADAQVTFPYAFLSICINLDRCVSLFGKATNILVKPLAASTRDRIPIRLVTRRGLHNRKCPNLQQ